MKVLIASSEAVPFAKTGGLGDVAGTLLNELVDIGVDARLIMPLYREVRKNIDLEETGKFISITVGNSTYTSRIFSSGKRALFIECDDFYDRDELYATPKGAYPDNAHRFIYFSRGVLEACRALDYHPDVIHCNDWQTAIVPLYMKSLYSDYFSRTATVLTIHNIGYQGLFPVSAMPLTGLDWDLFTPEGIEFFGHVSFLKGGIISAGAITTVSPSYAREILTEEYGEGLDGVLMKRSDNVVGILNGIDYDEWDPAADSALPARFSHESLAGKKKCRTALMREFGLKAAGAPLAGMVGRVSSQKGINVIISSAKEMISAGLNMVVLGKGDAATQKKLQDEASKYPGRFAVKIGFDEPLGRRIYAGSDIMLMPSKYEPCGLVQMIAMRYGTVPVVRATGGLADTVKDYNHLSGRGTGFVFSDYSASALSECVKRAICTYTNQDKWQKLARNCMKQRFTWKASAGKYVSLYRKLAGREGSERKA